MDEDASIAAALLTAGMIAGKDVSEASAFRTWRRQRNMILAQADKSKTTTGPSTLSPEGTAGDDSAVFESDEDVGGEVVGGEVVGDGDQSWSPEDDSSSVWFPSSPR